MRFFSLVKECFSILGKQANRVYGTLKIDMKKKSSSEEQLQSRVKQSSKDCPLSLVNINKKK